MHRGQGVAINLMKDFADAEAGEVEEMWKTAIKQSREIGYNS